MIARTRKHRDAELVAQAIIDGLGLPFQITHEPVQISVSIGTALYPWDASSPGALLQAADRAMYEAKNTGHNQMSFGIPAEQTTSLSAQAYWLP